MPPSDALCDAGDVRKPRNEESIARDLLSPHLDGTLISVPDPPDFVLCREGHIFGWLEVTTAVDSESLALLKAMKKHGQSITSEKLTRTWIVRLRKTAILKDIDDEKLIELFASHEAENPEQERGVYDDHWGFRESAQLFAEYGVQFVSYMPTTGTPTIYLESPGFSSSVHPSLVNDLATEKANIKSAQLSSGPEERHLVVLVNVDWPSGAWFALSENVIPEDGPDLPEQVTDVWLSGVRSLLWHFSKRSGVWEVIETGQ